MNNIAKILPNDAELQSKIAKLMWDASDDIFQIYHSDDIGHEQKADTSPVTKADLEAHDILVKRLESLGPKIPVVSEEDPHSLEIPKHHKTFWMIDPLDGTKEFIHRNGEFTCNLALITEQRPIYGWVSVPVQNSLYHGGGEFGAMREDRVRDTDIIQCKPQTARIRVVAGKSHINVETEALIAAL